MSRDSQRGRGLRADYLLRRPARANKPKALSAPTTTERICDEVAIEQYKEHRLGQVQATTLRGELRALRRLHRWIKKRKLLSALPEVPKVPKRAIGTPHKSGKRKIIKLSPAEMDAILAHLPEVTRKGYPVRDFVTFVRETSLRPSTVFGLRAPHDYEPGARLLRIRGENDKARFGRGVPTTDRARKALDSRFPCDGTIFPEFDCRDALREAALAAGISAHRASKVSIYDFRHGRGTEWGRTGNLIGIAYLMGHKHVTTTKEYLHSNLEEAQAVLFPTSFFTSPGEAAPTTSELIAQATEMIGCGREDSRATGIRQSEVDAVHEAAAFQEQYAAPCNGASTPSVRCPRRYV